MAQLTIEVNGRSYAVGCEDGQEAHLRSLAASVDQQVRSLAGDVGPLGETRLLLMAALMLADELSLARGRATVVEAEAAKAIEAAAVAIERLAAE